MAIDNLNYYVSGLPAGQQTDKYSANPGCVKSKNLDIFSSSKSVKATAWSEPVVDDGKITDQRGILEYRSDGKVYDTRTDEMVYDVAGNFISRDVSFNGRLGTYRPATWGTAKTLLSKDTNGVVDSFIVITDKASFLMSKEPFRATDIWEAEYSMEYIGNRTWKKTGDGTTQARAVFKISDSLGVSNTKLILRANKPTGELNNMDLERVTISKMKYYYDGQVGGMVGVEGENINIPISQSQKDDFIAGETVQLDIPIENSGDSFLGKVTFSVIKGGSATTYAWSGEIVMYVSDYNGYYNYLNENGNELVEIGKYWFEKGDTVQRIYDRDGEWIETYPNYQKYLQWTFGSKGVRDTDPSMDIVTGVVRNENPYLIGNQGGNGYIIPAPVGGMTETPYIAEGTKFLNAIPQDYYLYLVGEDRGVSGLYVYSGQQLVKILSGNKKKSEYDLVDSTEQYRFNGTMCLYRGRLVLGTEDGRLFMYGETANGAKGGAFIHEIDGNITNIKVVNENLVVTYTKNDIQYTTTLQFDVISKNYNVEWEAIYPITIGNHILEKEEADLYASYVLASKDCKLEFRGSANHYTYWSFKSEDDVEFDTKLRYKVKGWSGDYELEYIERNGKRYTFRLQGDLPVQTTNEKKITSIDGTELINYTEYNNFRRIGEATAEGFKEGKFRFHNINNILDLPNSHSIQIMVRGYGTVTHSPELFSVDLVASQRERG